LKIIDFNGFFKTYKYEYIDAISCNCEAKTTHWDVRVASSQQEFLIITVVNVAVFHKFWFRSILQWKISIELYFVLSEFWINIFRIQKQSLFNFLYNDLQLSICSVIFLKIDRLGVKLYQYETWRQTLNYDGRSNFS